MHKRIIYACNDFIIYPVYSIIDLGVQRPRVESNTVVLANSTCVPASVVQPFHTALFKQLRSRTLAVAACLRRLRWDEPVPHLNIGKHGMKSQGRKFTRAREKRKAQ